MSRGTGPPLWHATLRFSCTVSVVKMFRLSGTSTMPALLASDGRPAFSGFWSTATDPFCDARRPAIVRSSVVLPAPFGPRRASILPASTARSTSRNAVVLP